MSCRTVQVLVAVCIVLVAMPAEHAATPNLPSQEKRVVGLPQTVTIKGCLATGGGHPWQTAQCGGAGRHPGGLHPHQHAPGQRFNFGRHQPSPRRLGAL